jgi:transposase
MENLKQCIGIDVSKDTLVCCIGNLSEEGQVSFSKPKAFSNDKRGFKQLLAWIKPVRCSEITFVMEATGVYYENLAYYLDNQGEYLSVLLPNKAKYFSKSLNVKTKTDGVDAAVLSRIGLERKLGTWKMPSKIMREIKFLSREYREVKTKIVAAKNQLHAKDHSYGCPASVDKRLKKQIGLLEAQLFEIEAELRMMAMSDTAFYDRIAKISTIPGVSFITIICILAETNAFALVKNAKQLASYAGLDVQHNQSGTKQGKTKISKKGNGFIRHALYMPAMCARRYNPDMQTFYNRIMEGKTAKKIGITAIARKLLILIYILWKNDTEFVARTIIEIKVGRSKEAAYAG